MPPLMSTQAPVMKAEWAEARNTASSATSSRGALALDRADIGHVFAHFRFGEDVVEVGVDHARAQRVDPDARSELLGHGPRHRHHRAFGRGIGHRARPAAVTAGLRGHGHDRAALFHMRCDPLDDPEQRRRIEIHDRVPVVDVHLLDRLAGDETAGHVNQRMYLLAEARLGFAHELRHIEIGGHVAFEREGLATGGCDLIDGAFRALRA